MDEYLADMDIRDTKMIFSSVSWCLAYGEDYDYIGQKLEEALSSWRNGGQEDYPFMSEGEYVSKRILEMLEDVDGRQDSPCDRCHLRYSGTRFSCVDDGD